MPSPYSSSAAIEHIPNVILKRVLRKHNIYIYIPDGIRGALNVDNLSYAHEFGFSRFASFLVLNATNARRSDAQYLVRKQGGSRETLRRVHTLAASRTSRELWGMPCPKRTNDNGKSDRITGEPSTTTPSADLCAHGSLEVRRGETRRKWIRANGSRSARSTLPITTS